MDLLQKPFVDTFFEIFSTPESVVLGLVILFYATIGAFITRRLVSKIIQSNDVKNCANLKDTTHFCIVFTPMILLVSPVIAMGYIYFFVSLIIAGKKNRSKFTY